MTIETDYAKCDDDDNDPMFSMHLDLDDLANLNTITREALNKWRMDVS